MKKEECSCNNGFGIASVVLGIVGSVFGVLIFPIALSVIGLIFGIIQYKKAKNCWATWGIILSILGILISLIIVWQLVTLVNNMQTVLQTCVANPSAPGCENIAQLLSANP
ncbi:MAG: hypothetical protein QXS38_01705 [Candidatus Pacearchaeota archaeon]